MRQQSPRIQQELHPLLGLQAPNEQPTRAGCGDDSRVGDAVGLHRDPVTRNTLLDEELCDVLTDGEKPVDLVPGGAVCRDAGGGDSTGQPRTSVASVCRSWPAGTAPSAGRARPPVAEEGARRTDQAVVVHGVHHRDPTFGCGTDHRGAQQRKSIVHMHHVRAVGLKRLGDTGDVPSRVDGVLRSPLSRPPLG